MMRSRPTLGRALVCAALALGTALPAAADAHDDGGNVHAIMRRPVRNNFV